MNIYFSAAIYQKDKFDKNYREIVGTLEKWGHRVKHDHITNHTLNFVLAQSDEEIKEHYKKAEKWMRDADLVVIEASFPSTVNIGHEINSALARGKHVIVLYEKGFRPISLLSIQKENFICMEYSLGTLENDLEMALDYIEGQMDVRFNLFISGGMSSYLEEISRKERVSKSAFIRNLIKQHMKENGAE